MNKTNSPLPTPQARPPKKLSEGEQVVAVLLAFFGLFLIVGSLVWLGVATEGGAPASKESRTVESGDAKSAVAMAEPTEKEVPGAKTTEETDYAENLIIAIIAAGAVLMLSGIFFGRIREIKIGGAAISLDPPDPGEVADLTVAATQAVDQQVDDPDKKGEALKLAIVGGVAALTLASAVARVGGASQPSPKEIGEEAGAKAAEEVQESGD